MVALFVVIIFFGIGIIATAWILENKIIVDKNKAATDTIASSVIANSSNIKKYEKYEASFKLPDYSNPYDAKVVQVDGVFTSPSGQILTQPAFFNGDDNWKLRFTPNELGNYSYHIKVKDTKGIAQTDAISFTVSDSNNNGFIKVSKNNPQYFEYDSGKSFLGIGSNIAWQGTGSSMKAGYAQYFANMKANGGNMARVWIVNSISKANGSWVMTLQDSKLGQEYDIQNANDFDGVISSAEQNGIAIEVTMDDTAQWGNDRWESQNMYYKGNGGPLESPCDVFTNDTAKEYQKQVYRYIIARWGYSTSVQMWEFWNEIDEIQGKCTNFNRQSMLNWHEEMSAYVKSIDAHKHIIGTSTGSHKMNSDLYSLPGLQYSSLHLYTSADSSSYSPASKCPNDNFSCIEWFSRQLIHSVNGTKPSIIGEINFDCQATNNVDLHNIQWTGIMSGLAGVLPWYWDKCLPLSQLDKFTLYKGISSFTSGIGVNGLKTMKPINNNAAFGDSYFGSSGYEKFTDTRETLFASTNTSLKIAGLQSPKATYVWIVNGNFNGNNQTPATQSGTVMVKGLGTNASYKLETYDTFTGDVKSTTNVTANGFVDINVSNLQKDIAYKLTKLDAVATTVPVQTTNVRSPQTTIVSTTAPIQTTVNSATTTATQQTQAVSTTIPTSFSIAQTSVSQVTTTPVVIKGNNSNASTVKIISGDMTLTYTVAPDEQGNWTVVPEQNIGGESQVTVYDNKGTVIESKKVNLASSAVNVWQQIVLPILVILILLIGAIFVWYKAYNMWNNKHLKQS